MKYLALIMFSLLASLAAHAEVDHTMAVWDSLLELPPGWPEGNPYNTLAFMSSGDVAVLDHKGQPHSHGHVVHVIMDGGNNRQDPPNPDGSPGGDDSLAFGNFNMIRVLGVDGADDPKGKSGKFYSQKFFIPYVPNRAYYLRIWEGADPVTAPYYQDTIEYISDDDRGGAMIRLKSDKPHDVYWTFGPSKLRPASVKSDKKKK